MTARLSLPEFLARSACTFHAAAGGAGLCVCESGRPCVAVALFGAMATAQAYALRLSGRAPLSDEQATAP